MGVSKKLLGGGSIYRESSPYPQCQIFNCIYSRGIKSLCCFYCTKKDNCRDPCLNDPAKCNKCVMPAGEHAREYWNKKG